MTAFAYRFGSAPVKALKQPITFHGTISIADRPAGLPTTTYLVAWTCNHPHTIAELATQCAEATHAATEPAAPTPGRRSLLSQLSNAAARYPRE
jgi:hypothetical protein